MTLGLRWNTDNGRPVRLTPVVRGVLEDPGSPVTGPPDADVTVVVFTDYQCGICKRTDGALFRRLGEDDSLRVIWKDWPIRGPVSDHAARVALAAARQGKYAQVHAALMAVRGTLTPERVDAAAVEAGCEPARLAGDLREHAAAIDAQLGRHRLQAFGLGLAGTPGYLVGPFLIEGGLDDGALKRAVHKARREGPPR